MKIITSIAILTISIIFSSIYTQDSAANIVDNQISRVRDTYGSGQYGASRDRATRTHKGLDIITTAGETIYAPFTGDIIREAVPYANDPSYRGLVIKGIDNWEGYEVKIFYVEGILSGRVNKGQNIGTAQNLKLKYPTITNHIHVEVKKFGVQLDPFEIWNMSF
jgi:murein DD-endopeptidase MepM/ murein hydrolase activator NlpD